MFQNVLYSRGYVKNMNNGKRKIYVDKVPTYKTTRVTDSSIASVCLFSKYPEQKLYFEYNLHFLQKCNHLYVYSCVPGTQGIHFTEVLVQ